MLLYKKFLFYFFITLILSTPYFAQDEEDTYCDDKHKKGENCTDLCSENCTEQICYKSGKCVNCNDGFFGDECDQPCLDENAKTCSRDTGEALTCNVGFYINDKNCSKCAKGCDGDVCDSNTGKCTCKSGFYGEKCEKECDQKCEGCSSTDGKCLKCKEVGAYGDDCSKSCAEKCFNNKCDMNGICEDKTQCANDSLYGEKCEEICKDCKSCDIKGVCTTCSDLYHYGGKCAESCENKCTAEGCDINGICNNKVKCANDSLFGDKCENSCLDRCKSKCEKSSGNCTDGCNDTKYGFPRCEQNCSNSCKNNKCKDDSGFCDGCEDKHYMGDFCDKEVKSNSETKNCSTADQYGNKCEECEDNAYYGEKCEYKCNEGCGFHNCSKEDGQCSPCDKLVYGSYCNISCDGCGEDGCDDQGYCKAFECVKGKYGLKCNETCKCNENSNSLKCGKFSGVCLDCKFGYFGQNCGNPCSYKCKTGLCCLSKGKELKEEDENGLELETDYNLLKVKINEAEYNIEIDYNYGYPLTIFSSVTEVDQSCNNINKNNSFNDTGSDATNFTYKFTNYDVQGKLYKNQYEVSFGNNMKLTTDLLVAYNIIKCKNIKADNGTKIDGVIGLGFFNNLGEILYNSGKIKQNLLTYSWDKNKVKLLFGGISDKQKKYVGQLTSCNVILDSTTDIQEKKMTCKLDGLKISEYKDAFGLDDALITFSINEKSSFTVKNGDSLKTYLEKDYFNKDNFNFNQTTGFYYYDSEKINKLKDLGFVFNNYAYSYKPSYFFENENGKKKFLIHFSNDIGKSEFILGKEFLNTVEFTINNEEAVIYFYTKNAQYFIGDINKNVTEDTSFKLDYSASFSAGMCLMIIIIINLAAFAVYYFMKKRRMNNNIEYMKIE